jgi:hypothetical protein
VLALEWSGRLGRDEAGPSRVNHGARRPRLSGGG